LSRALSSASFIISSIRPALAISGGGVRGGTHRHTHRKQSHAPG
jgi:hypothetical protein